MCRQIVFNAAATLVLATACAAPAATPGPTPSTSPPPSPTAAPSTTAAPSPTASAAAVLPMHVGPHEPGRYRTTLFEPQLTFTLGSGWRALFQDDNDEVAFERSGPAFLGIGRAAMVVDNGSVVAAPDDLVGYLTNHPGLEVDTNQTLTVAGLDATLLEGNVQPGVNLDVFAYPTGNLHMTVGDRVRFYVVPLDGPDLVITIFAKVAAFDQVMPEVEPIVQSLEIAGVP